MGTDHLTQLRTALKVVLFCTEARITLLSAILEGFSDLRFMRKPFARLKFLPWRSLFQAAFVAVVLLALPVDILLQVANRYSDQFPVLESIVRLLMSPFVSLIIGLGLPVGLGALAVYVLERIDRSSISTGSLWGLVLCVALTFILEKWLLFGAPGFSMTVLVLIAVGVFWKGRPYWHSYRRW